MASPFVEENTASRRRLESFARSLSEEDLGKLNPFGWTVAALLAHLAFWDYRVVALLHRWQAEGVDESPIDSDAMNDALKPLCLALEPRAAVELCISAAEIADSEVERISTGLIAEIEASPTHFRFNRALHRNDHLSEIERILRG
jgi:hypothetical protein